MMWLGSRELANVSIKHLYNCPISKKDIKVADDVFGPNLGSLKGKTVHCPNPHMSMANEGEPSNIMKVDRAVTLEVDIMFINKV